MLKGKYLNPKYARRRKRAKRQAAALLAALVVASGARAMVRVDRVIRQTMLPSSPPLVELEQQQPGEYQITLLGREINVSMAWVKDGLQQLSQLPRTPSPTVRLGWQLWGLATGKTPPNSRELGEASEA